MVDISIDSFKSQLTGGGARPNRYRVTLNYPTQVDGNVEKTSFMIKGASLPAAVVEPIEIPFAGRKMFAPGDRTFEPLSLTIINDTDFGVRNSLESWLNLINGHKSNTGSTAFEDYEVDLTVDQLGRDGEVIKSFSFVDAFPTNLSEIELGYDNENTIEEFTCEFAYSYWESNTTS